MPNARRSALERLSAEQREFLSDVDGGGPRAAIAASDAPGRLTSPDTASPSHVDPVSHAKSVHGQPLRSVTLRLTPDTADALRRAALERGLRYEQPFTQQSIAEAAIRDWLARHGYLSS